MKPRVSLLRLARHRIPIFDQLRLEEMLYRHTSTNWAVLNRGREPPAIVMGIGSKTELLINTDSVKDAGVTVIRRFTGGGTVVVDSATIFVSIIGSFDAIGVPKGPRELMRWSEGVYQPVFAGSKRPFALRENDYVVGDHKCGGNAQGISRDRFVHHTSFLWDFSDANMALLRMPAKVPDYRSQRAHTDFLCKLKDNLPSQDDFEAAVEASLRERFDVVECGWDEALAHWREDQPVSTKIEQL